jgi:hypothetical protein
LGDTPGFGRQQVGGCLVGLWAIVLGMAIVVLRKKWAERLKRRSGLAGAQESKVDQS